MGGEFGLVLENILRGAWHGDFLMDVAYHRSKHLIFHDQKQQFFSFKDDLKFFTLTSKLSTMTHPWDWYLSLDLPSKIN